MDEILGKKIADLPEKADPVDTDVYVFGDVGSNVLKKTKWRKMLDAIAAKLTANNLTTNVAGFFLDARQGKALKDEVDELNTNISDLIQVVTTTGPDSFSIQGNESMEASAHIKLPTLAGYTRLFYLVKPNGNPGVVSSAINSTWICNTRDSGANAIRLDCIGVFVKNV